MRHEEKGRETITRNKFGEIRGKKGRKKEKEIHMRQGRKKWQVKGWSAKEGKKVGW